MEYALLKTGEVLYVTGSSVNGYVLRPTDMTFEAADKHNLFRTVSYDDVIVVDTNLEVINLHKRKSL